MPHFGQRFAVESHKSRSASAAVSTEFWKLCPSPWDNIHSSLHLQPCESPPLPSLDIPKGSHPCTGRIKIILLHLEKMLSPLRPWLLLLPSTISPWQQNSQNTQGSATGTPGQGQQETEYQFQPGSSQPSSLTAKLAASEAEHHTGFLSTTLCSLPSHIKTTEGISTHSLITLD